MSLSSVPNKTKVAKISKDALKEIAEEINKEFEGKSVTLICILKGSINYVF